MVITDTMLIVGVSLRQKFDQLLDRANDAKADTELALKDITDNIDGVDNVLEMLRGMKSLSYFYRSYSHYSTV